MRLSGIYQVATSEGLRWVRTFAKQHYEKPAPAGRTIVMELEARCGVISKKNTETLDLEGYGSR